MKKYLAVICLICMLVGCNQQEDTVNNTTESNTISNTGNSINDEIENAFKNSSEIDIDLTIMSSTMIYAEVNNMMLNPDKYLGKTIKVKGLFDSQYYNKTNQNYYFVFIEDASACCQQGIEILWQGDYPEIGTEIEVTGTFETYEELDNKYCHLLITDLILLS